MTARVLPAGSVVETSPTTGMYEGTPARKAKMKSTIASTMFAITPAETTTIRLPTEHTL